MDSAKYKVILFYKFTDIENPEKLRDEQKALCSKLGLRGRMLIANEGVNATFEGETKAVDAYITEMKSHKLFKDMVFKESWGDGRGFTKLKIKVRPEIVTLGAGSFDVKKETAKEVTADELDRMYENNEDFVVLDLRNDYEIRVGSFERTIDPDLKNFRDLPKKLNDISNLKDKKVVAVCTGGIRCEKATCLLQKEGFENLYQLKDGIHTYMQKYPSKRFKGTLFVFDNRMTTPIVDDENREVVGHCEHCGVQSENFYNDDSHSPSRKVICCDDCAKIHNLRSTAPVTA